MLQPSPQPIEATDPAAALIAFLGELSEPLLPPAERYDLLVMFSLLSGLAVARPDGVRRRAALCSDGTPIEFSLSLDDGGRHALRFVCDVGASAPEGEGSRQWFRDLADTVVPEFEGSRDVLDSLFAMHLGGAPSGMPFQVWFGAGAAPGNPRTGLLYFNTEWLARRELLAIVARLFPPEDSRALGEWCEACEANIAGVAYDFDGSGIRKVKFYLRLDGADIDNLEERLRSFPGDAGAGLDTLFRQAFGARERGTRGGAMLALGLKADSATLDASAYFHLDSWGVPDFAALAPIVTRLLEAWGTEPGSDLSEGPRGCAPTLLSLSQWGESERLAIYFKPMLGGHHAQAPEAATTAEMAES